MNSVIPNFATGQLSVASPVFLWQITDLFDPPATEFAMLNLVIFIEVYYDEKDLLDFLI